VKGIIFTELVDFIERHAGIVVSEEIIERAGLEKSGAFTSVGDYPHEEVLKLVTAAAVTLDTRPEDLMRQFGAELFDHLLSSHAKFLGEQPDNVLAFLSNLQTHIHDEVAKLYPNANPPFVSTRTEGGKIIVSYESHRPFALIALGLIEGCCAHFDQSLRVHWDENLGADDSSAQFTITNSSNKQP